MEEALLNQAAKTKYVSVRVINTRSDLCNKNTKRGVLHYFLYQEEQNITLILKKLLLVKKHFNNNPINKKICFCGMGIYIYIYIYNIVKVPPGLSTSPFRRMAVLHILSSSFSYILQLRLSTISELTKLFTGKGDSWQFILRSRWSNIVLDLKNNVKAVEWIEPN